MHENRVPRLRDGQFPLWLAPDQVRVITLNDDEALFNYAKKPIVVELRAKLAGGQQLFREGFSDTPAASRTSPARTGPRPHRPARARWTVRLGCASLSTMPLFKRRPNASKPSLPASRLAILVAVLALLTGPLAALAQTAVISDAWWSYEQDCDGDSQKAGTLLDNFSRLNWFPDVVNCNGTLNVYERIYFRPCGTSTWVPIYTNAPHVIAGCRSIDQQYVDIELDAGGECRDYKIEIYRVGSPNPDSIRSSTNDVHLSQHREETLAEDVCASDTFATCVALNGRAGSQSDNNSAATKETGEPDHAGNPGGHSLWYCWTAPTNRPVTFDTIGSSFDTVLAVYTGDLLTNLTLVASNDDIAGATNRMSRVTFTASMGTTYRVAVDGFGGASGIIELNWTQAGALPDLIVWAPAAAPVIATTTVSANNCQVLEGCVAVGTRRLLRFTMETRNLGPGDLVLGNPANNPLFQFATCHGHYHFESFAQYTLLDTNYNPVMLDTNVVVGRKVGFCIEDTSRWSPTAPASQKYDCSNNGMQAGWADVYSQNLDCQFVDVTGVPAGNYYLQMTVNPDALLTEADLANNTVLVPVNIAPTNCLTAPANDSFASAVVVTHSPFTTTEFNHCATKQSGEPNHAGNAGGHSIWFTWTPDANHTAVISTKRSSFDTTLGVYTGNAVNALSLIASNEDIAPGVNQSLVSFAAVAGTPYRIAVDGFGSAVGTVILNVNPPPNDDFASNILVTATSGMIAGSTIGASKEANEMAHAADVGGRSVWYRWVAPTNGFVDFNTLGSSFDTTLAIYTNATLGVGNVPVAANDDDAGGGGLQTSRSWFYARAGTTYRIAVDGFGGDFGDLRLNWNMDARLSIADLPDGNFKIGLTGVDWQRYLLLGSADLFNWSTNRPARTMTGGFLEYTNAPSTNGTADRQFYRAIRVP